METMLAISLYSYLCLKLAKILCLSYYLLYFFFKNIGEEGRTGSAWKGRGQERKMAQTMNAHMNK
jgi:hypothetical protein